MVGQTGFGMHLLNGEKTDGLEQESRSGSFHATDKTIALGYLRKRYRLKKYNGPSRDNSAKHGMSAGQGRTMLSTSHSCSHLPSQKMLTWDGRLRLPKRWQDIPVPDGCDYYDGYDPTNRASVDPKDLEVEDDEGNEIPIYDEDGFHVPRRRPILTAHQLSWRVLADLTLIRSLFDDEIIALDNEDSEDDDMESIEEVAPSTR